MDSVLKFGLGLKGEESEDRDRPRPDDEGRATNVIGAGLRA